ncbi:hypothetical protein BH23BAC1_BH23BAC1_25380 [soil metagenome]
MNTFKITFLSFIITIFTRLVFAQISPVITSFFPLSGQIGSNITIKGSGFSNSDNMTVYFGAVKTTDITFNSSSEIIVKVPPGATYSPITLISNGLTAYTGTPFLPTFHGESISLKEEHFSSGLSIGNASLTSQNRTSLIGDFNSDNKPDLLISNFKNIGRGSKFLLNQHSSSNTELGEGSFSNFNTITTNSVNSHFIADLNSDGKLDLVLAEKENDGLWYINIYIQNETSSGFNEKISLRPDIGIDEIFVIYINDLNKDGKPEILARFGNPLKGNPRKVYIFQNNHTVGEVLMESSFTALFTLKAENDIGEDSDFKELKVVDLNKDQLPEIIVNTKDRIVIWYNNYQGGSKLDETHFESQREIVHSLWHPLIEIADLNLDGFPDLIASGQFNKFWIYVNSNGIIEDPVKLEVKGKIDNITINDFNGDLSPDIAVATFTDHQPSKPRFTSHLFIFTKPKGSSISNYKKEVDFKLQGIERMRGISSGDLNLDGKPEIIIHSEINTPVTIILNNSFPKLKDIPFKITYNPSRHNFTVGSKINELIPDIVPASTSVKNFTIDPNLPEGLEFKTSTGVISGTPKKAANLKKYKITATSANHEVSTFEVEITVNDDTSPDVTLIYPPTHEFTKGVAITPFGPSSSTGNPTIFSIKPELPAGLSLNTSDGKISGTPTETKSTIKYTVTAKNSSGGSATAELEITVNKDQEPPQLQVSQSGSEIVITATDNVAIAEILYRYRGITSDDNFTDYFPATVSGTDAYQSNFSNEALQDKLGVEYEVVAKDADSNEARKEGRTIREYPSGLIIPYERFGATEDNYELLSIPLTFEQGKNTVKEVFKALGNLNKEKWRLVEYSKNVKNPFKDLTDNSVLKAGEGYWMIAKDRPNTPLNSGAGKAVSEIPFKVTLQATTGFQVIGNPYPFDISWIDIMLKNPGIENKITHLYILENGKYKDLTHPGNTSIPLRQFKGAVMEVNSGQYSELIFPEKLNKSIQNGRLAQIKKTEKEGWEISLNLSDGERQYDLGGFGMLDKASPELDNFDRLLPPQPGSRFDLSFSTPVHDFYVLTKDVVPLLGEHVWELVTETGLEGAPVELSWNNLPTDGEGLWLYDIENQHVVDMYRQQTYRYPGKTGKVFKIYYGQLEQMPAALGMQEPMLMAIYPNPVQQQALIPFNLPQANETYKVEMAIYNNSGARVTTLLNGEYSGGLHTAHWDRRDAAGGDLPPGMYLCNFTVITAGKSKVYNRKIILK